MSKAMGDRSNRSLYAETGISKRDEFQGIFRESVQTIFRGIVDALGGPDRMQETLRAVAANLAQLLKQLPLVEQRVSEAENSFFVKLLAHSWYFDPEMDVERSFAVAALIDRTDENAINDALIIHFRGRLDAIESELKSLHPKRAKLLTEAFNAHREKRYALSIPVFLAQTDGISRELLGEEFFRKSKSIKLAQCLVREVAGHLFLESALRSLIEEGAVRKNSTSTKPGGINRHAVLHGVDSDYASELNSLRAMSLLNFMNALLESDRERRKAAVAGAKPGVM